MIRTLSTVVLLLIAFPVCAQPPGQRYDPFDPLGRNPRSIYGGVGGVSGYTGLPPGFGATGYGQIGGPGFGATGYGQIGGPRNPRFPGGPGSRDWIKQQIENDTIGRLRPQLPPFDPSTIKVDVPRLMEQPQKPVIQATGPPAEWPSWASWEWALGLFVLCLAAGLLRGVFGSAA
jgi:hypothetical protein